MKKTFIKQRGLVAAFEELDDFSEVSTEVPVEEYEDNTEEVEEVSDDIEVLSDNIEEANDGIEVIEDIGAVMDDSIKTEEGLSEPAAKIAEIAIEDISRRLGIKSKTQIPAMESFRSKNSRLTATKVALEGVVWDKIKTITSTVGKAIVDFFKMVYDFVAKIIDAIRDRSKHIDDLLKFIEKNADRFRNVDIKETIKNSSIANFFARNYEKATADGSTVEKVISKITEKFNEVKTAGGKAYDAVLTKFKGSSEDDNFEGDDSSFKVYDDSEDAPPEPEAEIPVLSFEGMKRVLKAIKSKLLPILDIIKTTIGGLKDFGVEVGKSILDFGKRTFSGAKQAGSDVSDTVASKARKAQTWAKAKCMSIGNFFKKLGLKFKQAYDACMSYVKSSIDQYREIKPDSKETE